MFDGPDYSDMHNEGCWHYFNSSFGVCWDLGQCLDVATHLRLCPDDRRDYLQMQFTKGKLNDESEAIKESGRGTI
jgi:hypothetical protein